MAVRSEFPSVVEVEFPLLALAPTQGCPLRFAQFWLTAQFAFIVALLANFLAEGVPTATSVTFRLLRLQFLPIRIGLSTCEITACH
jgi:hypothetical protein